MLGGGVGAEVYGYAVELYGLGKLGRIKGEALTRARQLMGLLRDAGFSCPEVSLISGGRWKADDVRQYGAWSERPDFSRHDAALGVFAEFVSKGYRFEDMNLFLEAKSIIDTHHMSFAQVVTVAEASTKAQASIEGLVEFSKELMAENRTVKQLRSRMELILGLDERGFTEDVQERIKKLSEKYGGVDEFIMVLNAHESFRLAREEEEATRKLIASMNEDVAKLHDSKQSLEVEESNLKRSVAEYNGELAELALLYELGWNLGTLTVVGQMTKEWGGVKKVMEGMRLYGSLEKLRSETGVKDGKSEVDEEKKTKSKPPFRISKASKLVYGEWPEYKEYFEDSNDKDAKDP